MNRQLPGSVRYLALGLILLLGASLRLVGLDWDEGQHLHPDERFLTMVEADLRWPASLGEYLDEASSPLNPRNVGYSFFVYGTLPTTLVKAVALVLDKTGYGEVHLVGRSVGAVFDLGTICFLFLLARVLYRDDRIGLLAALLLSLAVLPIQLAHFFTVDSVATFFITGALYALAGAQRRDRLVEWLACGLFFGLAVACKLSSAIFALLPPLVAVYQEWLRSKTHTSRGALACIGRPIARLVPLFVVAFVAFRLGQPDAFRGPGLLGLAPSERWLANLSEVRRLVGGMVDYPPSHQWANRVALWHPWKNMVLWGMGLPLGLAAWAGVAAAGWRLVRGRAWSHLLPVGWTAIVFLYHGPQFVMPMRYFLPIYPTLILSAAWLLVRLWAKSHQSEPRVAGVRWLRWTPAKAAILIGLVGAGAFGWAFAFMSIYGYPHTRIQASRWIYENIAPGKVLANEHWDDGLPLPLGGGNRTPELYTRVELKWYDDDTPEKMRRAIETLDQADYVVLSSNRLSDSIPRLPMRYPMTTRYYQALLDGTLGFRKVADFTSYPRFAGLEMPDLSAEEPFTVYDHPGVQIFEKTKGYTAERASSILGKVDWEGVVRLLPKQVSKAPTALMFPSSRWAEYKQAGTWSAMFRRSSLGNWAPVLSWVLLVEMLGLLGAPYLFAACRGLPDRGYSFAKLLGLLLVGWGSWLLASVQLLPYAKSGILLVLFAWGLGAFVLARVYAADIRAFWQSHRRVMLSEEAVFWGLFLLFVLIRCANGDLWHPSRGGEKPMDFAYLNAVIKSRWFPPYDPWFAGGYMNYYYFGFVLWGTLIQLSGIVPSVAYNLIIPTLFAMTGVGAFGVVLALIHKKGKPISGHQLRFALLGPAFVGVIGNLGIVKLILKALASLGGAGPGSGIGGWDYVTRLAGGLGAYLRGEEPLPISLEGWYWAPTRAISHPPSEAGPITEFPWFTFLFGDLHAHAMALPLTLLALGLVFAFLRGTWKGSERAFRMAERLPLLGLMSLALGALWATNTWDLPTYAALALIALCLAGWQRDGLRGVRKAAWTGLGVGAAGYVLFLPFHRAYATPYGSFEVWDGSRTSVGDYLTAHGFFLFVLLACLLSDLWLGQGHSGVVRLLRMTLGRRYRIKRLWRLHRQLARSRPLYRFGLGGVGLMCLLCGVLFWFHHAVAGLIVGFLTLILLLFLGRRASALWRMTLALGAVALLLTLGVEYWVVQGDISRMNTVFKLYFQAWTLFALASAAALAHLGEQWHCWPKALRRVGFAGLAVLLIAVLLYPVVATGARIQDRFPSSAGFTLDGMAFLDGAVLQDWGRALDLSYDKQAIQWLQENVSGSPVMVEANTSPRLYSWGGRYSMFTGLPSIVGWNWHQKQQRAVLPQEIIDRRLEDVRRIYSTSDPDEASRTLGRYRAEYLIVGPLERAYYPPEGIAKFESAAGKSWALVYDSGGVQIYRLADEAPFSRQAAKPPTPS